MEGLSCSSHSAGGEGDGRAEETGACAEGGTFSNQSFVGGSEKIVGPQGNHPGGLTAQGHFLEMQLN